MIPKITAYQPVAHVNNQNNKVHTQKLENKTDSISFTAANNVLNKENVKVIDAIQKYLKNEYIKFSRDIANGKGKVSYEGQHLFKFPDNGLRLSSEAVKKNGKYELANDIGLNLNLTSFPQGGEFIAHTSDTKKVRSLNLVLFKDNKRVEYWKIDKQGIKEKLLGHNKIKYLVNDINGERGSSDINKLLDDYAPELMPRLNQTTDINSFIYPSS